MWNTEEEFSDNNFESDLVHWVSSNWLDLQKNQKTYLDSLNDVTTPPPSPPQLSLNRLTQVCKDHYSKGP